LVNNPCDPREFFLGVSVSATLAGFVLFACGVGNHRALASFLSSSSSSEKILVIPYSCLSSVP
jgi:hypothetical protein